MSVPARLATFALVAVCALSLAACGSSRESASADTMTKDVGIYPPPPAGAKQPKVGVPMFKVEGGNTTADTAAVAGDQLTTLAVQSERFQVIERAQLEKLLEEQGLEGVVKADEVAKPAQIKGVDYLLLGKITNFRVKAEKSKGGFNLGSVGGYFGAFDLQNSKSVITAECGVDLRLVDPSTGAILTAQQSEFKRTDSLSAMGVGVLGYHNEANAELEVDKDNQGKLLRLALDDALRKMLPKVDSKLAALNK
jgi:curli biogenesis system outer membrane secretion channel CsgG